MAEYSDALKLGQKEYRACVTRGRYPYLPVLDEILPSDRAPVGTSLGLIQIPAEFIVGTKTKGRTTSFARNFMPLMDSQSEFAIKWQRLCSAHLQEGIRDPVKVYEYMNRYYVEEGNKRVSVLKYFNAVNIYANVTRILPEKTDDPAIRVYYELVDFYRTSKINFVEFSKEGRYAKFSKLLGKKSSDPWTDEERSALMTFYHYFSQAYQSCGGGSLRCTTGDALLVYLTVYDYHSSLGKTPTELKKDLQKIWEDVVLQQEAEPVGLKLDDQEKKPAILPFLSPSKAPLHVAFVYDKTPQRSGWTYSHELGRHHVDKVFGDQIVTTAYMDAVGPDSDQIVEKAIQDGNTVIFTTTPKLLPASLRAAVQHPDVTVLNCSLNISHKYVRTYYTRIYEAKFIIGAIAGALASNDRIGYICDYPIFGMIAGVNAFALGAQMVNPRVKVYLEWSTIHSSQAAVDSLLAKGIDLISFQDMALLDSDHRSSFGLAQLKDGVHTNLAMPIWHWGVYYEKLIRRIVDRSFRGDASGSPRALNYYWGLSEGVVELIYSDHLPAATKKLAENLRLAILANVFRPFSSPFTAQDGSVIQGSRDAALTAEQIIRMDDLAENIIGSIPSFNELNEESRGVVDLVGVEKVVKSKEDTD